MKRNKLFLANGIIHLSGYLPLFYSLYSNKQESSEQIKESFFNALYYAYIPMQTIAITLPLVYYLFKKHKDNKLENRVS